MDRRQRTDEDDLSRLATARTNRAARWVAGAFTPANVAVALMAYVSVRHSATAAQGLLWWLLAVALVVGVPYLILVRALRSGRVDDRQVVRRSQRPALLASAAGAVAVALVVLAVAGAPRQLVWLVLAMLCGLTAIAVATTVWKASMHLAVSAGAVAVLVVENPAAAAVATLALPVVGWARWRDGRHSVGQLVSGAAIGGAVSGLVYGLLSRQA